jgi:hypothetical protein
MHILKILLFSLAPIISLFGQNNFVPGKITRLNGEVLDGSINDLYWDETPSSIQFKDNSGVVSTFYPREVLDFKIGEKAIYLSRLVEFDSVFESKEIVNNKNPSFVKKHIFLKVLVKASKSLLVYAADVDHFFIQYDDKVEALVSHHYNAKIGNDVIGMENKLYIIQLAKMFSDCATLPVTNKLSYKYEPLADLFSKYASCKGEEGKLFRKKEKTIVHAGLVGTVAHDQMIKGFTGGTGFGAGGFLNIYFPYKVYRHSLHAEMAYRMFGDQRWEGIDYAGFPYKETHQIRSMKLTIIKRWRLTKTPGLPRSGYTYIGAGAAGSFGLQSLYQRGPYVGRHANPFFGVIVNCGVYLFKNVAIDMRFEQGSAVTYADLEVQDNRLPQSKGYSSIQGSLLIEF